MSNAMGKVVHKFSLENCLANTGTPKEILIPIGAEIVHVEVQGSAPQMWAIVDPQAENEVRQFLIFGTGVDLNVLGAESAELHHRATFLIQGFVWHLFELV